MKVLVVGSGGREHALAWRLRQDDPTVEILAAPGNPGIAELGRCIAVAATDVGALVTLARETQAAWTLVGPEAALDAGIADAFRAANLPIFGPTRAAAQLESSKAFAKSVMETADVPTARALRASSLAEARRAIDELGAPVVIKASGLAAGKGVIVCDTAADAYDAARSMLEGHAFGGAGDTILVEEFMEGEELSLFVLTDGERVVALPAAQDHKRLLDGDRGPNTGGMGAYCPVSLAERSSDLVDDVLDRVARPTLAAMRARGEPFTGLLYVGLMLTPTGPRVVEFNCRFGDPETQALVPVLGDDGAFSAALSTIAHGGRVDESWRPQPRGAAVTTILAASGYPDRPRAGDPINLPTAPDDVIVFHAGTKRTPDGTLVTAGGRVLAVTGVGDSLDDAQRASQQFAAIVEFAGKQFRTDIGWRELARRAGAA
ncbi:MAG TPA: phosphoribosylamine--glycine ligase [Gemmatimonadaceae bacterium]|nr:phosphoribosylamine--glycine ligase [Gemmatimonadaceae bacterium]